MIGAKNAIESGSRRGHEFDSRGSILILGVWVYERKKEKLALYVAVGFGLFAISHALTLLGYGGVQLVILPLRAVGYLVVIAGLCARLLRGKQVSAVHGESK